MSLSVAFNTARSSLQATTTQISVSGRNLAGADDPAYTRKLALTTTLGDGSTRVSVSRATDVALFLRVVATSATVAGRQAALDGVDRLSDTVGDPEQERSPAALIGKLETALQLHANTPDDAVMARGVVTAAQTVATALNDGARTVLAVRQDADAGMAKSVVRINELLGSFETLNGRIVQGTGAGEDVSSQLDQRDAVLKQLSEEIGLTVVGRANNDLALYTDSGVPLFEKTARAVTFGATPVFSADTAGRAVLVDGVPVIGEAASMPLRSGRLAGLATLRDELAVTYQRQLDEIARGLIESFAETDQSGAGLPPMAGLFTYAGGPGLPGGDGAAAAALAGTLIVNAAAEPLTGGDLQRLRDGGMNGAAYRYNAAGAASFAGRLDGLTAELAAVRPFDPAGGVGAEARLSDFAAASVSWLEGARQDATKEVDYQSAVLSRASDALSSATGVSMDEEYAAQLQLEQSYAASSKLIAVVGQLFDALLQAVR